MVTDMCNTTEGTLTLAQLLKDPLVRLVMQSDNVSEEDHSALMFRVQECLVGRASFTPPSLQNSV
jgi:hypothetical protein